MKRLLSFLLACMALFTASSAFAYSGSVVGTFSVWNQNGNYCPSGANCTGARYPQSQYNAWQPVRNAKVVMATQSGTVIGVGTTDSNGNYWIAYASSGSSNPSPVNIWINAEHKDGRFHVGGPSGGTAGIGALGLTVNGGYSQPMGTAYIGSSSTPDPYFNTYWAAERVWSEAYSYVGVLQNNFTGVEIRGFANTMSGFLGTCGTSCADGATKRVQLDAGAAFAPQARVMHEMGHVASYQTHPFITIGYNGDLFADYCWPSTGNTGCGWSQATAEWGTSAFEEAFATYGANVTLWDANSVNPTSCLTASTCFSGGSPLANTNIEASSYPYGTNNCVANEGRWPLSSMRVQWDVYDSVNDGETINAGSSCFWCPFAVPYRMAEGLDDQQINEMWTDVLYGGGWYFLDNRDGRGSLDWANVYTSNFGSMGSAWVNNCSPP